MNYSYAKNLIHWVLTPVILFRFLKERRLLKLSPDKFKIYNRLNSSYWIKFRRFPDLINGTDYNSKIQRLKLSEDNPLMISCVDKVKVRDYVISAVGDGYLPKIYQVCDSFSEIDFECLPESFVLKTNHDSGSVILVRNKSDFDVDNAREIIGRSLGRVFGVEGGEWPYWSVDKKVFAEEYIGDVESNSPPADYKFHCVDGEVKWLQYIYDRGSNTKEVITDKNGVLLDIHFDENMLKSTSFEKPKFFDDMVLIAEKLSKPFKYVRVDMYLVNEKIYIGELTFFPMFGCYKGVGQKVLGETLVDL